jgi:hypothetical protein
MVAVLCVAPAIAGDESAEELIARAKKAAPSMISDDATIMDDDGNVLQEGSNGWLCIPNVFPDDGYPLCADEVWQGWLKAFKAGEDFSSDKIGFNYMLMGDAGVSNSDPMHPNPKDADDFIMEGAHLMIILPDGAYEGFSDDPSSGNPYVMWKDTPYVHLMVPLENRPQQ